jgi:hypothetical protein
LSYAEHPLDLQEHDSSAVLLLAAYRGEDLSPVELTRRGSKAA